MQGTPDDHHPDRPLVGREATPGPPVTEASSKAVMLRAERGDAVQIGDVVTRVSHERPVPSDTTVVRRTTPYFGPKLVLAAGDERYLLTAPGPDTQLLLWAGHYLDDGERYGWAKLAEVTAQLAAEQPQYDLCPECGQPMQTIEHERRTVVGRCPGPEEP